MYFRAKSRFGVERPRIFIQIALSCEECVEGPVLTFSDRFALWCGASSNVHLDLRSRVEHPRIFRAKWRFGGDRPSIFFQNYALA